MILFFDKKTGRIFGTINGRVHDEEQMKMQISSNDVSDKDTGKYVIGWTRENDVNTEHNMDKFDILKKFESNTPENPLDYKIDIETNNLIKK